MDNNEEKSCGILLSLRKIPVLKRQTAARSRRLIQPDRSRKGLQR